MDNQYSLPIEIPGFYFRFFGFYDVLVSKRKLVLLVAQSPSSKPSSKTLGEMFFEIYLAAASSNLTIYLTPPVESEFHVQVGEQNIVSSLSHLLYAAKDDRIWGELQLRN